MRGQGNLELALETRKKERKKERKKWLFFEHQILVLAYTIELMDDLGLVRQIINFAGDSDFHTYKFHKITYFEIFGYL